MQINFVTHDGIQSNRPGTDSSMFYSFLSLMGRRLAKYCGNEELDAMQTATVGAINALHTLLPYFQKDELKYDINGKQQEYSIHTRISNLGISMLTESSMTMAQISGSTTAPVEFPKIYAGPYRVNIAEGRDNIQRISFDIPQETVDKIKEIGKIFYFCQSSVQALSGIYFTQIIYVALSLAAVIAGPLSEKRAKKSSYRNFLEDDEDISDEPITYLEFYNEDDSKTLLSMHNIFASEKNVVTRERKQDAVQKLHSLVGLDEIKKYVEEVTGSHKFLAQLKKVANSNNRKKKTASDSLDHLIFLGEPGTGKTTCGDLFSQLLFEMSILKRPRCIKVTLTNIMQDTEALDKAFFQARNGVLFIDEAYLLTSQVSIQSLLRNMDDASDVMVIISGYEDEMKEFLESNIGLRSRFSRQFTFPSFSDEQLFEILKQQIENDGFQFANDATVNEAKSLISEIKVQLGKGFGNGRTMNKLAGNMVKLGAARYAKSEMLTASGNEKYYITSEDVTYCKSGFGIVTKAERRVGFGPKLD